MHPVRFLQKINKLAGVFLLGVFVFLPGSHLYSADESSNVNAVDTLGTQQTQSSEQESTKTETETETETEKNSASSENKKKKGFHIPNPFKKNKENTLAENDAIIQSDLLLEREESGYVDRKHKVHDLAYGEILMHFFVDNHYEALVSTNVALEKNSLEINLEHALLLEAQLYILEGLPFKAEQTLLKIRDGKVSQATLNNAFFQLARMHTYQGRLPEAKRILQNRLPKLEGHAELERKVLLANIYAIEKDKPAVEKALAGLDPATTQNAYLKFNLANAGLIAENPEFFLPILLELTQTERTDLETRSLQDFANLSLGKYYLKKEETDTAKTYLKAVGYEGLHSSEALYLLAWIELQHEEYKTAFAYWANLSRRNPGDRFVGKSFLYRPYTLEKLNSTHLALSGYMRAGELYDRLIKDVEQTIEIVNSDAWLQKLQPESAETLDFNKQIAKRPTWLDTQQNEVNFLLDLYASDHFANVRQNFWELELILRDLNQHRATFEVFKLQRNTHRNKYDRLIPEAQDVLASEKLRKMHERIEALENELSRMNSNSDFLAVPTTEQADRLKRIQYAHDLLDQQAPEDLKQQRNYLRLLEGVNAWEMSQNMNERQWQIRTQYNELQSLLEKTRQHQKQIELGIKSANATEDALPKILDASAKLEWRYRQTQLLSLKHQKYLRELAIKILEERRKEYKNLKVKAKLAAARLQDSIVTGRAK